MAIYSVTYDLKAPGRKYDELYKALKAYGSYAVPTESQWLIETQQTSRQIVDNLKHHVDANDTILVTRLATDASGYNVNADVWNWIQTKLR